MNLLVFLRGQAEDRAFPQDVLDQLEAHQKRSLCLLDELEKETSLTEDDAFRFLLALSAPTDTPAFVRGIGSCFLHRLLRQLR